ncbi:hypothetical protein FDI59_gp045 [Mycobacterium phage Yoshi]|uniref:Uncharacterized protein n=1 Tax=Mycobacterium phage Yoshi TaxID=2920891 RepID=G1BSF2_9CAUD|nr:hypothetical protein FDI59_gp045 [Mycobacterium phage Yoshi]AEK07796.1 hypothetical protein YOSHI_45 [Mycobacterium phage Yoshi]
MKEAQGLIYQLQMWHTPRTENGYIQCGCGKKDLAMVEYAEHMAVEIDTALGGLEKDYRPTSVVSPIQPSPGEYRWVTPFSPPKSDSLHSLAQNATPGGSGGQGFKAAYESLNV